MINVWSRTSDDHRKCRSCIAGNFQEFDPLAQRWTAQAEPSSIFIAAKLAAVRMWTVSKLDVKGAFLNAPIPENELILVQPPKQWADWGIVEPHVVWKLNRAVYGLRQSPKWWSDERDLRLKELRVTMNGEKYYLQQNEADSQVWSIAKLSPCGRVGLPSDSTGVQLGLLCVYVDDFLILAPSGPVRDALVESMKSLWEFGKERVLTPESPLTFLGIDWTIARNGDIHLSQERFAQELLKKYNMHNCRPVQNITLDKPPEKDDIPTPEELTELQSYAGAFNWLATRTRPDLAYFTSLLASSASRKGAWSRELAHKVLRYLAGSAAQCLIMTAKGSEDELLVYTDAGFAGADTKSQSGPVIFWAGSIITWRSSRASLSALSTAEAELVSAAMGWQVAEGIRYLLNTLKLFPAFIDVMIDNKAALTAATLADQVLRRQGEEAHGGEPVWASAYWPLSHQGDGRRRLDEVSHGGGHPVADPRHGGLPSDQGRCAPHLGDTGARQSQRHGRRWPGTSPGVFGRCCVGRAQIGDPRYPQSGK
jgi:hypothetical protein